MQPFCFEFLPKQEHIFSVRPKLHSVIKHLLKEVNQSNMLGHLDKCKRCGEEEGEGEGKKIHVKTDSSTYEQLYCIAQARHR